MTLFLFIHMFWFPIGAVSYVYCFFRIGRVALATKVVYRLTFGGLIVAAALENDIFSVIVWTAYFMVSFLWKDDDDDDQGKRHLLELKTALQHLIDAMNKLRPSAIPLPQPV